MEGIYIFFFFTWISISKSFELMVPQLWQGPPPEIRLYMPDDELKKTWRVKELANGIELFHDPWYEQSKPTMLILHGWFQGADDEIIVMILDSLFKVKFYEKMNIMVLDAPYFSDSAINNMFYYYPARKIEIVGNMVADLFNQAMQQGLIRAEDINLLGLSLGAQMSGYVGRATNGVIYSIVGLDPAGPGFDSTLPYFKMKHVNKGDARFVHLYHTNSVTFGTSMRLGTADFEFNEGLSQPGCATSIDPKCSHKRSFYIFNDMILGDENLIAQKCDSLQKFKDCECEGGSTVVLQYPVDTRAKGLHFLKTTDKAPFGLGEDGITCLKNQQKNKKSTVAKFFEQITEKIKDIAIFHKGDDKKFAAPEPNNIS